MAETRTAYDAWHASVGGAAALDTPWHRLVRDALDVSRDLAGKRVLEIACGRGDFAAWCTRLSTPPALLVGADFSEVAVQLARSSAGSSGRARFFQADAQTIGLASASFDTVICCETLEHLHDPQAALRELARVLRPGGRLFLTTPNYLGPMGAYRGYLRLTGRRYSEEGQPVNRFLLAPRLRNWVRRAGLDIVRSDATGHYLPWPRRAPILLHERAPGLSAFGLHALTVAVRPGRTDRVERATGVCFIVESGTDARLLEGLAARVSLTVLARDIPGARVVSQPTSVTVETGSSSRLAFAWRVFRWLLANSPDAVLVQGYGVAALAANAACRIRNRRCWMLVCSPAAQYYAARRAAGARFSRTALAGIHALAWLNARIGGRYVVLSEYLRTVVSRNAPATDVHVIPVYGVDAEVYVQGTHDRSSARRSRGLPLAGQIVFNSSRVAPEKDTATLIEAFRLLVNDGRDVYLLHRSGGHREFAQLAAAAGVASRVIATDAVDPRRELPLDYLAADVCVQASREEGLGFSVLEALACGTPVVATAVGGLNDVVKDGVTGWTAPPGDAAALANALRGALDRPDDARRRTAAGAAMVRERFDSQQAFNRLAELLGQQS